MNTQKLIEEFRENFDNLTFAQQSILSRTLEKNKQLEFQDDASIKCNTRFYSDYHSDYYDVY